MYLGLCSFFHYEKNKQLNPHYFSQFVIKGQRIPRAIEEQGAATTEISRNVLSTADKTRDVTENLKVVTESVKNTEESANEVLSSSQSVKSEADSLKGIIDGFLEKVRAA